MLKNILKLDGAQKLTNNEQKSINGAGGSNYCDSLDTCIKGVGNHVCEDTYGGVYLSVCNCCITQPL